MTKFSDSYNQGFSLVEAVITIAIISLILGSVIVSLYGTLLFDGRILKTRQATLLADEGIEGVRALRDSGWNNNITPLTIGTKYYLYTNNNIWKATTTASSIAGFYRTFKLSNVYRDATSHIATSGTLDPNTKLIDVTVAWLYRGATTTVATSGYITNLFND